MGIFVGEKKIVMSQLPCLEKIAIWTQESKKEIAQRYPHKQNKHDCLNRNADLGYNPH